MSVWNVQAKPAKQLPTFRKVALGTWKHPSDPQIYGTLEIDLTNAFEWRAKQPEEGPRLTVLHMVAKAIAMAMAKYPDLNGLIRFGRIYLRERVDIFFQVLTEGVEGRTDLTGVRLKGVDEMTVGQIAEATAAKVEKVRARGDTELQKTSKLLSKMPGFFVSFLLWLISFLTYTLNLKLPGSPRDPFGSCMISNVGSIGLETAWAPLVPYSRAPMVILIGRTKPQPVVIDGEIEVREMVSLNASIDHRFCDGALLAKMVKVIKQCFDDPDAWFGE